MSRYNDKDGKAGSSHASKKVKKYCWSIQAEIELEGGVCQQEGCTSRREEGCVEIVRR